MSGGVILAAPASGSGKTTITLALLRHLHRRGSNVASAKLGPDYIDPAFHAAASGAPCRTLDPWAMRRETLAGLVAELERAAEFTLCEGALGLFDGAGLAAAGSTADLAELTGWPVVLVVDVHGQGASAAALVQGFARHRPGLGLAGVILNRIASARHRAMIERALEAALPQVPVLGAVPRHEALGLPARHLGLVPAAEHPDLNGFLDGAAAIVGAAIDEAALLALARRSPLGAASGPTAPLPPFGQRIAVARDVAFAFAYPATLDGWRRSGAEISFFSPLADEAPPQGADTVFLPGGYPELHAGRLAANGRFRAGVTAAAARGAAVYGECGGYMALGQSLIDAHGTPHAMAGLLPLVTSFAERRLHLGYRTARLRAAGPLGAAGSSFRGHEFHHATIVEEGPGDALFDAADADGANLGKIGRVAGRVAGSFLHLVDRA